MFAFLRSRYVIIMAAGVERADLPLLRRVGDDTLRLHLEKSPHHLIESVVVLT